jgi:hypothetical protein
MQDSRDLAMRDTQQRTHALAERYRRFAENEARGFSPLYEHLALYVAGSGRILDFLMSLPAERRQPNLLLAAVRRAVRVPRDGDELERIVGSHGGDIARVMLARTTQTNEPARCAVMLPILARLPQPLALIEVGASAGLCLLPDRYGYDYGRARLRPQSGALAPVFPCAVNDKTPLPSALPTVIWRAGLDLNPLSVSAPDDMTWLEMLVWPEQQERLARLRAAIEIARRDPPRVVQGNLLSDLGRLLPAVPPETQLVIFHTAVLAYIGSQSERDAFADLVRDIGAVWISNEMPGTFPRMAAKAPRRDGAAKFLLAMNGEPVAWTGPHGQSIDWFAD